jgi:hypothetical protein
MFENYKEGQKVRYTCYGSNYRSIERVGVGVIEQRTRMVSCTCTRPCMCNGRPILLVRDIKNQKVYGLLSDSEIAPV